MDIFLLRHGEAEETSSPGRDPERRLTSHGRETAAAVARALGRLAECDLVLSSPIERAKETAELVKEVFSLARYEETDALIPAAPPRDIERYLAAEPAKSVVLVGHQPHLGRLLGHLVTGRDDLEIPLRKACLASVRVDNSFRLPGRIRWLISPKIAGRIS